MPLLPTNSSPRVFRAARSNRSKSLSISLSHSRTAKVYTSSGVRADLAMALISAISSRDTWCRSTLPGCFLMSSMVLLLHFRSRLVPRVFSVPLNPVVFLCHPPVMLPVPVGLCLLQQILKVYVVPDHLVVAPVPVHPQPLPADPLHRWRQRPADGGHLR